VTQELEVSEQRPSPEAAAVDREIRLYVELRASYEDADEESKRRKKLYEEQEARLYDVLESAGIKTANHDLGRFTRRTTVRAKVEDDEALRIALDDMGLLDAFTKQAWRAAELNAWVKEMMEDFQEFPEGVNIWTQNKIAFTAKKPAVGARK
jgi:hypothetical protein